LGVKSIKQYRNAKVFMLLPIIALKGKSRRQTTDTRVWFENPLNLGYFKRKKKE